MGAGRGVSHLKEEHSPVLGESSPGVSTALSWGGTVSRLWEEASPVQRKSEGRLRSVLGVPHLKGNTVLSQRYPV